MFPLRLIGINMADEAADTFTGGVKNFLGALGFISPLLGGEELIRWYLGGHTLPWWFSVGLIVAGLPIYTSPAAWKSLRRIFAGAQSEPNTSLQYLSGRDSELGSAIISMARQSAWGRWYAAQQLVNSGTRVGLQLLYQIAAGKVMDAITNGELEVRGRRPDPKRLDYEPIDRTHWRSCSLVCVSDPITIWKMKLIPIGGVELDREETIVRADNPTAVQRTSLLDYDSLIIDAYQFEKLWPKRKKDADKERRKFLLRAWWRGLDRDERRRLC
jgi:hypothetical protein